MSSIARATIVFFIGLSLAFGLTIQSVLAQPAPDRLVEELTEDFYETLEANRDHYRANPDALKAEIDQRMRKHMDTEYAARLVLGRYGRGLEQDDINRFADALATNLMDEYATRVLELNSENEMMVLPISPDQDPRRTRVRTRLRLDNGSMMPIDFVVRLQDDQWLLFDVIVEGISYVATYRTQIGEEIAQRGFETMLERLERGQVPLDQDS
jgi:phospholipid transport system substrate-binding protein